MANNLSLSTLRPDFDDLVAGLQQILLGKSSWTDLVTSSTGAALLDMISSVGTFDQYSIQQALLNAFPSVGSSDSAIYAITQMLGIRLTRKTSVTLDVQISNPIGSPTTTISAYSQFSGAGSYWYNSSAITLVPGAAPQTVTLKQGLVKSLSMKGTSTDYQTFVSQERGFLVSDSDVLVFINGTAIPVLTAGLWEANGTPGVQDITLPDGRLGLMFGTELFGSRPLTSDDVSIFYSVTSGTDATSLITSGQTLAYGLDSTVVVTCADGVSPKGGGDEKSIATYKSVAAPLFGTFGSSVTRNQHISTILTYPGVTDAITFAQRESNPKALAWMNVIRCVLLTQSTWDNNNVVNFLNWMQQKAMYASRFFVEFGVAYPITIDMDIYCANSSTLSQTQANVANALYAYFNPSPGVLNRDVYRSDIIALAKRADPTIDYVVLTNPSSDILMSRQTVRTPTYTTTTGSGTLAAGTYDYAISYTSSFGSGGQVAPTNWVSVAVGANGTVTLNWEAVANVTNYLVWGRLATSSTFGLIATLSGSTLTFTDNGATPSVAPVLAVDTRPIYYASLPTGNLSIRAHYSSRNTGA